MEEFAYRITEFPDVQVGAQGTWACAAGAPKPQEGVASVCKASRFLKLKRHFNSPALNSRGEPPVHIMVICVVVVVAIF